MILRRLQGSRFSEVLPAWEGMTAVIIGGGPSLTFGQVETVREAYQAGRVKCIAVNDAYLLAPWADVIYSADAHWHAWHCAGIPKDVLGLTSKDVAERWETFGGQKCSIQSSAENIRDDKVHILRNKAFPNHGMGLSLEREALITGRNSGFQSLNLAILAGAKRIILLGFDAKSSEEGKTHWFGEHPRPMPLAIYPLLKQAMSEAAEAIKQAGVTVLNCSPGSAIDAFDRVELESALAC